ncbi:Dihydrofolate reductase [Labilithrix luteola]|uniref:Dihydrofolate reductase n=1 Tax=Labilithrix luteola TaxID=1391654 RepID=A0A0K1QFF0_9BACT|nr:dihydrofolate reductase family protein [Labilithrix luteola]AKV04489.1 Dihydrofolate reductase [Labilithrix luteola]
MRPIIMFNRVSADGYFARPEGDSHADLSWVVPEEQIDKAGAAASSAVDTILFGRKTYDMFESFWPHAIEVAKAGGEIENPHGPVRASSEMRAMAEMINAAKKIVYSRTRKSVTWNNSQLRATFDPQEIREYKKAPGKGIIIFGSGSIVSLLAQHDLIDEYQIVVSPLLLGSGESFVRGVAKTTGLTLVEAKGYPSGNVMLRYSRKG